MAIADKIGPELPYLRRYARALTGNQNAGDRYVEGALEALIADASTFNTTLPPRVAIYRVFTALWNSLSINTEGSGAAQSGIDEGARERRLSDLTPLPRQAFLLVSLEGFTPADAAKILDLPKATIDGLLHQAGAEIALQLQAKILIIEDEPMISMDLEGVVADLGHSVQAVARTHAEAVTAVSKNKPDLVLADIHLADGSSGLEAVDEILKSIEVPVIFITGYPERLLTGTKPEPVFLVTKPYDPSVVKALISQALFFELRAKRGDVAVT